MLNIRCKRIPNILKIIQNIEENHLKSKDSGSLGSTGVSSKCVLG